MSPPPIARILIVDDEAPLMTALCETLRDRGYDTVGFTTPGGALAALKQSRFDLVLTDLAMSEMDGVGLLQAALELDPNLVGIIMTGEGTIASAVQAMRVGAFDYILKPFKVSVILPVLSRALGVRRLRLENAALLERVQQRTAELEAANKELEAFSYSVSHDLRAPLRAVSAFSAILVEQFATEMPEEARRLLDYIHGGARKMDQLIDDLLRFSHVERQPLSKRRVNMRELAEEALLPLRAQPRDRPIEVRMADLPESFGDPALLRLVYSNLLSNAFKFTGRTDRAVVEVGWEEDAGRIVYFVRDNGAGFDMQYADKLFRVFQRLHSTAQFEGTGVGLSLVQRIVDRHGGRVWAKGEPDRGATFFFWLGDQASEGSSAPLARTDLQPGSRTESFAS